MILSEESNLSLRPHLFRRRLADGASPHVERLQRCRSQRDCCKDNSTALAPANFWNLALRLHPLMCGTHLFLCPETNRVTKFPFPALDILESLVQAEPRLRFDVRWSQ